MGNDTKATSGAQVTDSSGSGDNEQNYSKEFVEKLLKEKKNYAESAKALREERQKLADEIEGLKTQDLQKQNQYKELYENAIKKQQELSAQLKNQTDTITSSKKKEELTKHLFKLGLDDKYLDDALKLSDLNSIQVDPETFVVVGADDLAKSLKEKYKDVGFFKKPGLVSNHNGASPMPTTRTGTLDVSKMTQAEKIEYLAKHKRG